MSAFQFGESTRRIAGGLLMWGGAVIGILQLKDLPVDFGHGICGPWGCGPPLQVLLACHGFWIVNLAALWWIGAEYAAPAWRRATSLAATIGGAGGLVAVAVWQWIDWWPQASEFVRPYVVQRYLFTIATLIDVPLVQLALFGLAGTWSYGRVRRHAIESPERTLIAGLNAEYESRSVGRHCDR